tara:strand:- start:696 stop:1334 length:639 start_codon:yes stop_codon:yes gene_type:complete
MNFIFDLDGTIIDSSSGIYKGYTEAIIPFSKPIRKKIFVNHIGPPIQDIIKVIHPELKPKDLEFITKNFRNLYDNKYFLDFKVYKKIHEEIEKISKSNQCFIVTNKPTSPAKIIIKKLNLDKFFIETIGVDYFIKKGCIKSKNLSYLIKKFSLNTKASIYIGDTYSDFICSKDNNISFIGFLRGYYKWSNEEIKNINNFYDNPRQILEKIDI